MFVIVSCVWTMSVAETEPWIVATVHQVETFADCSTDGCPACYGVFMASVPDMEEDTSPYSPVPMAKFYQLTVTDAQIAEQLNKLPLGKDVTIEGVPFTCGGSEYIQVAKIHERDEHLPSLCDGWNTIFVYNGFAGTSYTPAKSWLSTDTIINGMRYAKLMEKLITLETAVSEGQAAEYIGALREDQYGRIYFIPDGKTHEYLLYDFNVRKGDLLSNVWFGGGTQESIVFTKVVVADILSTTPRTYVLDVVYNATAPNGRTSYGNERQNAFQWIEGVGLLTGPVGEDNIWHWPAKELLCAYKEDKQVYISEAGNRIGCYYELFEESIDTIQLYKYVKDGPGSSTVDPVDPNQVVATLQGEYLTIHEYTGDEIGYTLQKSPSSAPARRNTQAQTKIAADTFRGSASIQVSEYGTYTLELTNPLWDYTLVGTFYYGANGLEPVTPEMPAYKYLIDGRMFIRQGDHIYTPTGMQVE